MMGILSFLFPSSEKIWKVGEHRVKGKEVRIPGTVVHGDTSGVTARRKTKYRCIDCEKVKYARGDFNETCCYSVIEQ